jgi:hypothetical protein
MKSRKIDEIVLKRRNIEKILLENDKKKYNMIYNIFNEIAKLDGNNIQYLTNFKRFSYDFFQENIVDIRKIIMDRQQKIKEICEIEIDVSNYDYKKIIFTLRKLLRTINYKIFTKNNYISVKQKK